MSYLEGYGVREARTEKRLKYIIFAVVLAVVLAASGYFLVRDRSEKSKVSEFVDRLKAGDYNSAYALWGCTPDKPCPEYPMNKFLEDWGPGSAQAKIKGVISDTARHCDSGILQVLNFP